MCAPGKYSIRAANLDDLAAILALEQEAETAAHWPERQYRQALSGEGPQRLMLIAEENSAILGMLIARAVDSEWELENIVVDAKFRRRGLGELLVVKFAEIARGRGGRAVYLEVRTSNAAAAALYRKCAFVEISRRRNYYPNPSEDAVVYMLDL